MFRYLQRLLVFFLPVAMLTFAFPFFVYIEGREFTSIPDVIKAQSGSKDVLFELAYNNAIPAYKEALVKAHPNAHVLILGASRTLQFHSSYFIASSTFINTGAPGTGPEEWIQFIKNLPSQNQVRVIILDTDALDFKPGKQFGVVEQVTSFDRFKSFLAGGWRQPLAGLFHHQYSVSSLIEQNKTSPNIGVLALITQIGYMNDGSHFEYKDIHNPNRLADTASQVNATVADIQSDRSSFDFGTTTDPNQLKNLQTFLTLCKERNIYVIGFIPPYHAAMYNQMMSVPDVYAAEMKRLPVDIGSLFSKFGYPLFNYMDGSTIGIQDSEFLDVSHPTAIGH